MMLAHLILSQLATATVTTLSLSQKVKSLSILDITTGTNISIVALITTHTDKS